jgi:hypothetical protein
LNLYQLETLSWFGIVIHSWSFGSKLWSYPDSNSELYLDLFSKSDSDSDMKWKTPKAFYEYI